MTVIFRYRIQLLKNKGKGLCSLETYIFNSELEDHKDVIEEFYKRIGKTSIFKESIKVDGIHSILTKE